MVQSRCTAGPVDTLRRICLSLCLSLRLDWSEPDSVWSEPDSVWFSLVWPPPYRHPRSMGPRNCSDFHILTPKRSVRQKPTWSGRNWQCRQLVAASSSKCQRRALAGPLSVPVSPVVWKGPAESRVGLRPPLAPSVPVVFVLFAFSRRLRSAAVSAASGCCVSFVCAGVRSCECETYIDKPESGGYERLAQSGPAETEHLLGLSPPASFLRKNQTKINHLQSSTPVLISIHFAQY